MIFLKNKTKYIHTYSNFIIFWKNMIFSAELYFVWIEYMIQRSRIRSYHIHILFFYFSDSNFWRWGQASSKTKEVLTSHCVDVRDCRPLRSSEPGTSLGAESWVLSMSGGFTIELWAGRTYRQHSDATSCWATLVGGRR